MSFYAENLHKGLEVTVLLSCPGRYELVAQKPAAKQTGANLELILEELGLSRASVAINNATIDILYKAKDARTEAKRSDVLSSDNIDRLDQELFPDTKVILAMGENAYAAALMLKQRHPELIVVKGRHPGFSSLNRIKFDSDGKAIAKGSANATKQRAKVVAKKILSQTDLFKPKKGGA